MCVLCVCVCWWSLFTSSVSLHSLSIHCHYQFSYYYSFFFPCRSSSVEEGELSLHPSLILSLAFQLLQMTFFFSLYVLHLWTDWTLGDFSDCLTSTFLIFFLIIIFFLFSFLIIILYPFYVFLSSKTFLTIVCQKSIILTLV